MQRGFGAASRRGVSNGDVARLERGCGTQADLLPQYVLHERAISFQIPIGLRPVSDPRLVIRMIDPRDLPADLLLLGQMRGRTLPVATARFALQLSAALAAIEAELAPELVLPPS